jgi:hypothetical protein
MLKQRDVYMLHIGDNMKLIKCLIFALILLSPAVVKASGYEGIEWTTKDTILQGMTILLLEVDREQTKWIAKHPVVKRDATYEMNGYTVTYTYEAKLYEKNKIVGLQAHNDRVNAYFIASAVGHTAIAYGLPHLVKAMGGSDSLARWSRTAWQAVWIGIEGNVVYKNKYSAGVKLDF